MDFTWSDEQERYRDSVVRFAQHELNDELLRRDAEQDFPHQAWKKCGQFGLLGLPAPEAYGGSGADPLTVTLALEALGYGCRDNGLLFSLNAHLWSCVVPIFTFGSESQKQRYLPGLCDGTLVGVQGMTEPDSGSDAFSLKAVAELRGDNYVINGVKTFITNAPIADVFVIFASTEPQRGFMGFSAFLIDRDAPGVSVGAPFEKMGLRTSPMSEVILSDCVVPKECMLASPGAGMAVFNTSMEWERSFILASALGTMRRQLEGCVAYARQRKQFGQSISKFQAVSHRIVEMRLRLKTSQLLLYELAWTRAQGKSTAAESAMAKLHVSQSFLASSMDALWIHGASGYMTSSEIERDVRDAIASGIYSGTSDIQRNIVAARMGL